MSKQRLFSVGKHTKSRRQHGIPAPRNAVRWQFTRRPGKVQQKFPVQHGKLPAAPDEKSQSLNPHTSPRESKVHSSGDIFEQYGTLDCPPLTTTF
jgi:hypothetical protein